MYDFGARDYEELSKNSGGDRAVRPVPFHGNGVGRRSFRQETKKHHAEKTEEKAPCEACEAIKQLKEQVAAQQAEIDQLKGVQPAAAGTTDAAAQAAAAAAQQQAAAAKQAADAAAASRCRAATRLPPLRPPLPACRPKSTPPSQEAQKAQKEVGELENPPYIHYKGIEFYPAGYLAAETVWRQHAEQTDVLSSFNGIPFPSTPTANMTEFRGTGRQSRLAFKAIGHAGDAKITGYYEMDFLGAAPTANENQSNSFTPRVRQAFGEMEWHDWSLTGGQAWTLLTLNKQGIETLGWYNPDTIDAQYVVGFTFARLMSMRLVKSFDDKKVTAAFAIENSAYLQAGKVPSGVIYGGTGSGSLGNSNTYTNSLAPDLIAKVAFDPSFGHFEIKAVGRFLRDRVEATSTLPVGETNTSNTTLAGGFGVDAYVPVLHKKLIPHRIVVVWPRHCPLRRFVQRGLRLQTEWHDCASAEPPGSGRHRSVPDPEAARSTSTAATSTSARLTTAAAMATAPASSPATPAAS